VANLDNLQVVADVYEQDLAFVHPGQGVTITVAAYPDLTFPGMITHIGDGVDRHSRTINVRGWVTNEHRRLKPEMFARLRLGTSERMSGSTPVGASRKLRVDRDSYKENVLAE